MNAPKFVDRDRLKFKEIEKFKFNYLRDYMKH
jgi:hypothetical protein